ncbi:MAG: peptidoglycan D,D-transpeptidase FtsI family protein [Clostridia bacterium]
MKYNKKIIWLMVCMCVMFLSLAVYLTYFTLFEAESVIESGYNKRIRAREESVLRGSIYDNNGVILAYSRIDENGQSRVYPYGERYAHIIGYNMVQYGRTGLESSFNEQMVTANAIDSFSNILSGSTQMEKGADLYLTLNNDLTAKAEQLMKKQNGAVVALNPKTGAVLCMYSNPSFDTNPESLEANFGKLSTDENAPFLGRAAQGLYAPGSTFKIITAAAALEKGCAEDVEDTGSLVIDGYEFKNYDSNKYGLIDTKTGFAKSSNVMFAKYGLMVGENNLKKMASRFGIGEKIPFDTATSKSLFSYPEKMSDTDIAACGIGQGKLLVTPLNMALVASAIANDGIIMEPYIVEKAAYNSGNTKSYEHKSAVWKTAVSKQIADEIESYMIECVNTGTGKSCKIDSVTVAGKTGTAENEKEGKEHAWFVCYAPVEDPSIAICVMQEYTGKTGSSCAPIAKELIKYYLNK